MDLKKKDEMSILSFNFKESDWKDYVLQPTLNDGEFIHLLYPITRPCVESACGLEVSKPFEPDFSSQVQTRHISEVTCKVCREKWGVEGVLAVLAKGKP